MQKDMTKGNPLKLIILFTIPLIFGNMLQQLYQVADTYIISQVIGVEAFAAVGSTVSINTLVLGFSIGLTSGLSVLTAQRFGQKDEKAIRENLAASVIISVIFTIVLTILSISFRHQILEFMNTPTELYDYAEEYLFMLFLGIVSVILFNLVSNLLRAVGEIKAPLAILALASILNIILDLVFLIPLDWGVSGVGFATLIAQGTAGLIGLWYIKRNVPMFRIHKEDWAGGFRQIKEHLIISFPMGFQTSIIAIGMIAITMTVNSLGSEAVAALTASQKVDAFATKAIMAIGVTMATYTAQNYGAGEMERVWEGVKKSQRFAYLYSIVIGLLLVFFGQYITMAFVGPEEVEILEMTRIYFLTNSTFYILLSSLIIHRYTLQGFGKSTAPTLAGIFELFARVAAALVLSEMFGFLGVALSNVLAWIAALIPLLGSYYLLRRKLKAVNSDEVKKFAGNTSR